MVLDGAGSLDDIGRLISKFGNVGAAAGSLFVTKGVYRAVLINYPNMGTELATVATGALLELLSGEYECCLGTLGAGQNNRL